MKDFLETSNAVHLLHYPDCACLRNSLLRSEANVLEDVIDVLSFFELFVAIYVLVVIFDTISQVSYHRKSLPQVKAGFRWMLLKDLLLVTVLMVSTLICHHMGWDRGPHFSN